MLGAVPAWARVSKAGTRAVAGQSSEQAAPCRRRRIHPGAAARSTCSWPRGGQAGQGVSRRARPGWPLFCSNLLPHNRAAIYASLVPTRRRLSEHVPSPAKAVSTTRPGSSLSTAARYSPLRGHARDARPCGGQAGQGARTLAGRSHQMCRRSTHCTSMIRPP